MIPKSIIIFGIKFKVEVVNLVSEGISGDSHLGKRLIRINSKDKIDEQRSTLLHEVLHMALGIGGIEAVLPPDTEEAIVVCLENALHQLVVFK